MKQTGQIEHYFNGHRVNMTKKILPNEEICKGVNAKLCEALEFLIQVKEHKDTCGKDDWYKKNQPIAWAEARQAVENYKKLKI